MCCYGFGFRYDSVIRGAVLQSAGKGDTELGTWVLEGLAPRDFFPGFYESAQLSLKGDGVWNLPDAAAGFAKVDAGKGEIYIRAAGRMNNNDADKWTASVTFAPKAAGAYRLAGKINGIWFDGNKSERDAAVWAVIHFRGDDADPKVIADGRVGDGDSVDFAESAILNGVTMKAGEKLQIVFFRSSHWHAAGATLRGLDVSHVQASGSK